MDAIGGLAFWEFGFGIGDPTRSTWVVNAKGKGDNWG